MEYLLVESLFIDVSNNQNFNLILWFNVYSK